MRVASLRLDVREPLRPADVPGLYAHACGGLANGTYRLLEVAVAGVKADAVLVDAIARLVLVAHRHDCAFRLLGAAPEVWDLIDLSGLRDAIEG